ncbi:AI-2E family transporter [Cognatilysobacter lacus]|uniref:AI-2E family transporter n=1 Tax=Cognatilysobacter lacus TaxID=1643323 RepID=A0A5D8Z7T2_9GAMM|nr:AI-2E family transporter [Lysobacter lacus]TZF90869.1 AI-2E family transporter [Lysobacter lacus]
MAEQSNINRALPVLVGGALVLGFLYWAKVIVIPVALAILFTFLLTPPSQYIERRGVSRAISSVLMTLLALALAIGAGVAVTRQVSSLLDAYPRYEPNVTAKIEQLRSRGRTGLLDKLQSVTQRISTQLDRHSAAPVTQAEREAARAQPVRIVEQGPMRMSQLWSIVAPLLEPLAGLGLVLVLVIFMLIHREDLRDRLISLIGVDQLADTTRALEDAGERVSRYLLMQLAVNSGFGLCIAIGLWVIGVPYALLWGFFAAVLRYIPYLGSSLSAFLPVALSLLISREWTTALLVVALFGGLELVTNMLVEPMVYGRGMGVSQAALLIAVAFWTWLWGPVGLVLASPLTVCLVVLGRYVPFLKFLDTLLGDTPPLAPAHRFYQRLLAQDDTEAADLLDDYAALDGLERAYDEIVVPTLAHAREDLRQGRLDAADHERIVDEAHALVDAHRRLIRPDALVGADLTRVLAIPVRDAVDEVAVSMLGKLVDMGRIEWTAHTSAVLASDVIELVRAARVDALVLVSVPPGGLANVRYLAKKLGAEFEGLPILVVRPGLLAGAQVRQRRELAELGVSRLAPTLTTAAAELRGLASLR